MRRAERIFAKYVCLDIVKFTHGRSEDAQIKIFYALDEIVKNSLEEHRVPQEKDKCLCLPTGDGMCIVFINNNDPDIHLRVALGILKGVAEHNGTAERKELEFEVRVGVNSHTDNLVTDVAGNDNIVGVGINTAFRIMDLADGRQILVGPAVYAEQHGRPFGQSFVERGSIVKHGAPLVVYQMKTEGLSDETPDKIRDYKNFIGPAEDLGLTTIYESRHSGLRKDIIADIEGAKDRVWILGVGLKYTLNISDPEVYQAVKRKYDAGKDVKILLLDGLRSPAVFRALLESDEETFKQIVRTDRSKPFKPPADDPYFKHPLYTNFRAVHEHLDWLGLKEAVRFYAHSPNCWLVIVDDKIYYQPYSFGDGPGHEPADGQRMPVLKFKEPSPPASILSVHFNKLWQTSEFDLFQTTARIKSREIILHKLFELRSGWFRHVYGVLHNKTSPGKDRRTYSRQRCISPNLVATVKWPGGVVTKSKVVNHSREGVLLALSSDDDARAFFDSLPEGKEAVANNPIAVEMKITSTRDRQRGGGFSPKERGRTFLVEGLLKNTKFLYARKDRCIIRGSERLCVALRAAV
jgi:hypothetical protein